MKKFFKLFMIPVLVITLLFSYSSLSFAASDLDGHNHDAEGSIVIMAPICPYCDQGSWISSSTYTAWVFDHSETCNAGHYSCVVKVSRRIKTSTYHCTRCSATDVTSTTEYKSEHVKV